MKLTQEENFFPNLDLILPQIKKIPLYDENENVINDIKFVKNRYIMYSGSYKHMAYGHHGSSIEDGRLTLNIFFNRINNGS